jgi:hypothetical protein
MINEIGSKKYQTNLYDNDFGTEGVVTWKVEGSSTQSGRGNLSVQERIGQTEKRMWLWGRLSSPLIVPCQSFTTTAFAFVKLFQEMESAPNEPHSKPS